MYDPSEQDEILDIFLGLLDVVTKDGGTKRANGTKVKWTVDPFHEEALFRHLARWKSHEYVDPDSGAHPLVHAAWRCLAIAYQETTKRP